MLSQLPPLIAVKIRTNGLTEGVFSVVLRFEMRPARIMAWLDDLEDDLAGEVRLIRAMSFENLAEAAYYDFLAERGKTEVVTRFAVLKSCKAYQRHPTDLSPIHKLTYLAYK